MGVFRRSGAVGLLLWAGLLSGCMAMVPSTQGKPRPKEEMYSSKKGGDDDEDGDYKRRGSVTSASTVSDGALKRKVKHRPSMGDPDEERQQLYDEIVASDGRERVSQSVRTDLDAWRNEAAKQEDLLRKYEMRIASDDEVVREIKRKRDRAYDMVEKYETLNRTVDGGSIGKGRSAPARSNLVVDPMEFSAPGTTVPSRPQRTYAGAGAGLTAPAAADFLDGSGSGTVASAGMAPSSGVTASTDYYSRGLGGSGEWVTKEEE